MHQKTKQSEKPLKNKKMTNNFNQNTNKLIKTIMKINLKMTITKAIKTAMIMIT
jgi:hypothetical protein